MKIHQNKIWESVLMYSGAVLILILVLWNIKDLKIIHVLNDEYGYWASAAFFAGKDWSEVTANSNYYSYGYSLLLSIFMRLFDSPEMMVKGAVVLNGIFLAAAYFLTVYCGKKLFPREKNYWIYIMAFVITSYSNNIVQSQICWPENLLYLLFWVIVALFITLYEKTSAWKIVLLALCNVYMYMVHQRSLAVVAASVIFIIVLAVVKKIQLRHILLFAGIFICLFGVHSVIKQMVISGLFQNSALIAINDYSGQLDKLKDIFTSLDGFARAVAGFFGKVFYVGAATLGVGALGLYQCVKGGIILAGKRKEEQGLTNTIGLFVGLSAIFALGINTIFMVNGTRIDCVIYGRYTDYVIGPVLLMGFLYIFSKRAKIAEMAGLFAGILICGVIAAVRISFLPGNQFNIITNIGVSLFYRDGQDGVLSTVRLLIFLTVVFVGILFIVWIGQKKVLSLKRWVMAGCLVFWISTILPMFQLLTSTHESLYGVSSLTRVIQNYSDGEVTIDYVTDKNSWDSREIEYIQFLLPDAKIHYESVENLQNKTNGENWIIFNTEDIFSLSENMSIVSQWGNLLLCVSSDSSISERLEQAGCVTESLDGGYNLLNSGRMASQNRDMSRDGQWISNGEEGYLIYGPYMTLGAGSYVLEIELSGISGENGSDGGANFSVDVSCQGSEIAGKDGEIQSGKNANIQIPFQLEEKTGNIEFRVYILSQTIVEIDELILRKL